MKSDRFWRAQGGCVLCVSVRRAVGLGGAGTIASGRGAVSPDCCHAVLCTAARFCDCICRRVGREYHFARIFFGVFLRNGCYGLDVRALAP